MMSQEQKNYLFPWILSLSLGLICALEFISPAVNAIEFPNAPEREPPKSTAAGGRRGGCVSGKYPIKAFTPSDDNYIKTVSSQPQLFVYLPKTKAKFLQFIIKEDNGENVSTQEIPVVKGDYVMKINLPDNLELETNKKYQWEISLVCNPMFINTANYTQGMIERVALTTDVKTELSDNEEIIEQAQVYANQNIWSETLSLVSTVRESQPEKWKQLLTSVGLQDYVEKEFQQPSEMIND